MFDAVKDRSWLLDQISSLVAYPRNKMTDSSGLRKELGLTSSDLLFIQLAIEEKFSCVLEHDENFEIHTVGDLLEATEKSVNSAESTLH